VTERRITNENTGGQKGQKTARFDLIPTGALWEVAELYGKGAEKYDDRNWELGYDWNLSYAAMQRHAQLFWAGEDRDPETGCHHLASVVFHCMALMTFAETYTEGDNRPSTKADMSDLNKVLRESLDAVGPSINDPLYAESPLLQGVDLERQESAFTRALEKQIQLAEKEIAERFAHEIDQQLFGTDLPERECPPGGSTTRWDNFTKWGAADTPSDASSARELGQIDWVPSPERHEVSRLVDTTPEGETVTTITYNDGTKTETVYTPYDG
jgi:hypothetical protein